MDLIRNKKATFNYEILEELEAGIELLGLETKSIRAKQGSLEGSYIIVRGGEAFLVGADFPAFQPKNAPASYERTRNRKLLLTKPEIANLVVSTENKGLTIVPISLYNKSVKNSGKIKLRIAVVRGKKKADKRASLKKREADRDMRRTLKNE